MPLLRSRCLTCGAPGPTALCGGCRRRLVPPPSTRVRGIGVVPALFAYDGVGAGVIQALKFRDGRRLVGPIAEAMAALVRDDVTDDLVVSWLPTSASRRRHRGFDQAELLARALARRLERPAVSLLRRSRAPTQTGRSREAREANVTFSVIGRRLRRAGGPILIVDDVCTTGATARAARAALEPRIDGPIRFVMAARTP